MSLHVPGQYTYVDCVDARDGSLTAVDLRVLPARAPAKYIGIASVKVKPQPAGESDAVPFPEYLRRAMAERGFSGAELARRSGANPGSISNLLTGRERAGIQLLTKLAGPLGIELTELLVAAGKATAESMTAPPMPPQFKRVLDYAEEHGLTARQRKTLFNIVEGSILIYEGVIRDLERTPREPKMRDR